MAITRRDLADTYSDQDAIIEAAQTVKREATQAYRKQLDDQGMDRDNIKAEIEGFKLAYRRKVAIEKKGEDVVDHRDAIADEIFEEITASHAPRATRTREALPEHDADGVIIEDNSSRPLAGADEAIAPYHSGEQAGIPSAGTGGEADRQPNPTPDCPAGEEAGEAQPGETSHASPAPVSEPVSVSPLSDADAGDRGQSVPPPSELAPVVTSDRTKPNPWCRDPGDCGIEGSWDYFCEACKLRKRTALAAAAHQDASEGRTLQ